MSNNDRLEAYKVTVKKIAEIFTSGDSSSVNSIFSPDYVDHQKPEWLKVDGSEEFKQIVSLARKSLPNLQVTIEDIIAEDNRVVARLQWHSVDDKGKKIER